MKTALLVLAAVFCLPLAACASHSHPHPHDGESTDHHHPEPGNASPPALSPTVLSADGTEVREVAGKARITFLARGHNAFLGRLEMEPGGKVPAHRDATEEYIHVLEGHGTMWIDGREYDIQPGTTVFMPANAEVSYQNGDARFVGIQVFAGPAPAAKYDADAWKVVRQSAGSD